MDIKINEDIPRTMTLEGLRFLGELARQVPENGVIVEVGPLFGSSTWVLAKNAHPSVKVYSLDTWEPAAWIDKFTAAKFPSAKPFSKKTFEYYVRDCPNVTPIQGWSPDSVADWDKKIDLFFDDASHGNPGFINNINFFEPFVKPGCVMCGDDYASGSPDIVRETDLMADNWKQSINIVGRVWALRKPENKDKKTSVYKELEQHEGPHPMLETHNASGVSKGDYPAAWVGKLHKYDPLNKFKVFWDNTIPDLDIMAQCRGMDGVESEWITSGNFVAPATSHQSISSVRFVLTGEMAKHYQARYQVGYCYPKVGRQSGAYNSKFFGQNSWTVSPNPDHNLPINAIRLILDKKTSA